MFFISSNICAAFYPLKYTYSLHSNNHNKQECLSCSLIKFKESVSGYIYMTFVGQCCSPEMRIRI